MQQFGNKYNDAKLSQMKMWLQDMADKGSPKYYEIYVDDTLVVNRTSNLSEFDDHTYYMDQDSRVVKVFVYNTPQTHRYKQYIYEIKTEEKKKKEETPLNGLDADQRLVLERERWDAQRLKEKLEENQLKLKEAEEYIEKLTALNEKLKAENDENKGKTGWLGLAEKALNNPVVMMKVGELAGVFPKKDQALNGTDDQEQQEETEVTITKKKRKPDNESVQEEESEESLRKVQDEETHEDDEEEPEEITPEQFEVLKALQKADQKMKQEELSELGKLMNKLTDDPSLIIVVNDLIKNNTTETEKNY